MRLFTIALALLLGMSACQSQQNKGNQAGTTGGILDARGFDEKLKSTAGAVLLDVRTAEEYGKGHIAGAQNLDFYGSSFAQELDKLDKTKPYFIYCAAGSRSGKTATMMSQKGFTQVYDLQGGMMNWQQSKMPVETGGKQPVADKMTMQEYEQLLVSEKVVLIDYYAPWCAPCIQMKPMLEELDKEYEGKAKIIRLNVDENPQLADKLGVAAVPIFHLFKEGKEVWKATGAQEKSVLKTKLDEQLK